MHDDDPAILESVRYLASDQALRSIEANTYWPKWDSPWWHMTTLHEMGLAKRIPERAARKMTDHLKIDTLRIFPIHPGDLPEGTDPYLGTSCHCALGNIYQALSACGIAVDEELPWIRSWFLRYQLPDGGLNCDEAAYLHDDRPSSMVGTIAPLEAILLHTAREFTDEERDFLDRGARFLLDRKLMRGSTSPGNAQERDDEADWLKPCFPRLYLYDVLRGLSFVVKWAERRQQPLPREAISEVVEHLTRRYPDGQIRIERHAYESVGTRARGESGEWVKRPVASLFPLLERSSRIGMISSFLTGQWAETRAILARLAV